MKTLCGYILRGFSFEVVRKIIWGIVEVDSAYWGWGLGFAVFVSGAWPRVGRVHGTCLGEGDSFVLVVFDVLAIQAVLAWNKK